MVKVNKNKVQGGEASMVSTNMAAGPGRRGQFVGGGGRSLRGAFSHLRRGFFPYYGIEIFLEFCLASGNTCAVFANITFH